MKWDYMLTTLFLFQKVENQFLQIYRCFVQNVMEANQINSNLWGVKYSKQAKCATFYAIWNVMELKVSFESVFSSII